MPHEKVQDKLRYQKLPNVPFAFGHVLRKWRVARKLTQTDLAEFCDLDRTFIFLLERGERQPTLTTIFLVSRALRVSPAEFVGQIERKLNSSRNKNNQFPPRKI